MERYILSDIKTTILLYIRMYVCVCAYIYVYTYTYAANTTYAVSWRDTCYIYILYIHTYKERYENNQEAILKYRRDIGQYMKRI
jgi:hypothetical protein